MADFNQLKVILAEKKRTNKWLAETLGGNPTTVSKWCANSSQPDNRKPNADCKGMGG